ncbi:MAG TPA: ATP-dependent DNA helicase RecQ [Longimicrobiales bacterium]|nr:ATP-dependent DNA helicase RecQ [Longimicrobiales bacterium]
MSQGPGYEAARAALERVFGYPDFRGRQPDAVRAVLAGRDVLVLMPTGGGKSLCYQVPALVLPGLTIVVSPLISLMKDQVDALVRRDVPAALLNSTLAPAQAEDVLRRARNRELRLLYVAPERFNATSFRTLLPSLDVTLLAIDEAHCISQWGHDFRPAYRQLGAVRDALGCPCVALTATATPEVRDDIQAQLRLRDPLVLAGGFDRANLDWHVLPAPDAAWKDRALVALLKRQRDGAVVVYAPTRKTVDALADFCTVRGLRASAYHAGITPPERQRLQEAFMRDEPRIMIATNAFGMGVDKPNVRLVVHYTMAGNLEGYYQEAGRAGRDGASARCVLLYSPGDALLHEFMIDQSQPPQQVVRAVHAALLAAAGADGMVRSEPRSLATAAPGDVNENQVGAVLRRLAGAGIIEARSDAGPWRLLDRSPVPRLDWHAVRNGREREQRRLAAMLGYVETRDCRRGYVLRYYGEEPAQRCTGCDRCLGKAGAVLPGWAPARAARAPRLKALLDRLRR